MLFKGSAEAFEVSDQGELHQLYNCRSSMITLQPYFGTGCGIRIFTNLSHLTYRKCIMQEKTGGLLQGPHRRQQKVYLAISGAKNTSFSWDSGATEICLYPDLRSLLMKKRGCNPLQVHPLHWSST